MLLLSQFESLRAYRVRLLSPVCFGRIRQKITMMKRFTLAACARITGCRDGYTIVRRRPAPARLQGAAPALLRRAIQRSGFYVGINGGYGFGTSNWTQPGFRLRPAISISKGAVAGGTLGYNLQTGAWVWGIEGDIDYSWIQGTDTTTCGWLGCETQNNWLATGRLRVGYAWDRWLPYITGGAAGGNISWRGGLGTESKTKIGWTAGAGLEYAFLGAGRPSSNIFMLIRRRERPATRQLAGGATIDRSFKTSSGAGRRQLPLLGRGCFDSGLAWASAHALALLPQHIETSARIDRGCWNYSGRPRAGPSLCQLIGRRFKFGRGRHVHAQAKAFCRATPHRRRDYRRHWSLGRKAALPQAPRT